MKPREWALMNSDQFKEAPLGRHRVMLTQKNGPSAYPAICENWFERRESFRSGLPPEQLEALNAIARRRLIPAEQTLFEEGAAPEWYATILRGVVKLTKTAAAGDYHIVALKYPSEFLGYESGDRHRYSAVAGT